jgi:hypothetical protein
MKSLCHRMSSAMSSSYGDRSEKEEQVEAISMTAPIAACLALIWSSGIPPAASSPPAAPVPNTHKTER